MVSWKMIFCLGGKRENGISDNGTKEYGISFFYGIFPY